MSQFPSNPTTGQQYFDPQSGVTYTWDGGKWVTTQAPFNLGATGATGSSYGLYAFAKTAGGGIILPGASENLTVTRPTTGTYNYTFVDRFFDPDKYGVVVTPFQTITGDPVDTNVIVRNITETGFTVFTYSGARDPVNRDHAVQVFSTASGPTGTTSVYQTWTAAGNIGTVDQFLDSLIGPTGPQGVPGLNGSTGATGPTGATGLQGEAGNSITVKGTVATFTDLLTSLPSPPQDNDLWIVADEDGEGYVYVGTPPSNVASDWDPVGKIQGPPGATGPLGATGATSPQGPQGDPSTDGGFFLVVGERNGSPSTNQYYAWGNGASTRNQFVIPATVQLAGIGINAETNFTGNYEANIVIDGVASPYSITVPGGSSSAYIDNLNVTLPVGTKTAVQTVQGVVAE